MTDKELATVLVRIEKLEHAVFSKKISPDFSEPKQEFVGVVGGLRLLVQEEFFNKKKTLSETRAELITQDYPYSLQAVQTALSRLSKTSGPLVTFKEGGKKVYAKRK